jgi:hypothetical protein
VAEVSQGIAVYHVNVRWSAAARSRVTAQPLGFDFVVDPRGRYVALQDGSQHVTVRDGTQDWKGVTTVPVSGDCCLAAFSADGQQLALVATTHANGAVSLAGRLWTGTAWESLPPLPHVEVPTSAADQIALSPGARYFAMVNGLLNGATVWERSTGWRPVLRLRGAQTGAVAFSPDGRFFAASFRSGFTVPSTSVVRVWSLPGFKVVAAEQSPFDVVALAFSPDGRFLVGGGAGAPGCLHSDSGGLQVWEKTSTWHPAAILSLDEMVCNLAISADGRYALTAMADNTVRIWDSSWVTIARLPWVYSYWLSAVAFTPDGRYVTTASTSTHSGLLQDWVWRREDFVQAACARVAYNLSPQEWRLYLGDEPYQPACPHVTGS